MRRSQVLHSFVLPVFAVAVVVAVAGCSANSSPAAATTATPTTETFSDTIAQSGTSVHSFAVSATGTVTISLTAVSPLSTMALGVGVGTWDGSTCGASFSATTDARSGATALTGTATKGDYCVRVYDSGNVPADWSVSYTVEVVHP